MDNFYSNKLFLKKNLVFIIIYYLIIIKNKINLNDLDRSGASTSHSIPSITPDTPRSFQNPMNTKDNNSPGLFSYSGLGIIIFRFKIDKGVKKFELQEKF